MRIWENETQCLDFGPFPGTKGQAFLTRDAFPYEGFISILNRWEINGKIVSTKLFELWEGGLLRMLWNNILMFFFGENVPIKNLSTHFFTWSKIKMRFWSLLQMKFWNDCILVYIFFHNNYRFDGADHIEWIGMFRHKFILGRPQNFLIAV